MTLVAKFSISINLALAELINWSRMLASLQPCMHLNVMPLLIFRGVDASVPHYAPSPLRTPSQPVYSQGNLTLLTQLKDTVDHPNNLLVYKAGSADQSTGRAGAATVQFKTNIPQTFRWHLHTLKQNYMPLTNQVITL